MSCPTTCSSFCSWYFILKPISWMAGRQKHRNRLFNFELYYHLWKILSFWKAITKPFLFTVQSISNRHSFFLSFHTYLSFGKSRSSGSSPRLQHQVEGGGCAWHRFQQLGNSQTLQPLHSSCSTANSQTLLHLLHALLCTNKYFYTPTEQASCKGVQPCQRAFPKEELHQY